jgi:DNA-binding transcriptional MerR regulator
MKLDYIIITTILIYLTIIIILFIYKEDFGNNIWNILISMSSIILLPLVMLEYYTRKNKKNDIIEIIGSNEDTILNIVSKLKNEKITLENIYKLLEKNNQDLQNANIRYLQLKENNNNDNLENIYNIINIKTQQIKDNKNCINKLDNIIMNYIEEIHKLQIKK